MVFIWSSNRGPRRRRPRRGYGPGWGGGYGPGYGYGRPGRGYGHRRRNDSCLRDLLFLNTGCCLANAVGCSMDAVLVAPSTLREVRTAGAHRGGRRLADRLIAGIRVYQREISLQRPPSCRFTPTCSQYGVEALEQHGAARGTWLTVRRLVRCRPGAAGGADPVPAQQAA